MTSTTSFSLKSKLDLRAPVLTQLSRRTSGDWRRLITLFFLDTTVLFLAWQVTKNHVTPVDSTWNIEENRFALWPIITTQVALIATEGLYNSGEKRRDYFRLVKALTFSHVLLLLIAFLYQPGEFVSRSTFILSWLLSLSFTCAARFGIDTAINHLREQGAVRGSTFLICRSEDREKAVKLLGKENCYNLLGWADVNLLAEDTRSWDATLEHIYHLGVAEVFICSWQSIKSRMFLYWKLRTAGITLHILPVELETIDQNLELKMIGRLPALKLSPPLITGGDFLVKRCFDFCCATLFVLLATPLYLFIA